MKIKIVIITVLLVLVCQLTFGKYKSSSNSNCFNELKTHYYSCGEMPFGTSRRAEYFICIEEVYIFTLKDIEKVEESEVDNDWQNPWFKNFGKLDDR